MGQDPEQLIDDSMVHMYQSASGKKNYKKSSTPEKSRPGKKDAVMNASTGRVGQKVRVGIYKNHHIDLFSKGGILGQQQYEVCRLEDEYDEEDDDVGTDYGNKGKGGIKSDARSYHGYKLMDQIDNDVIDERETVEDTSDEAEEVSVSMIIKNYPKLTVSLPHL